MTRSLRVVPATPVVVVAPVVAAAAPPAVLARVIALVQAAGQRIGIDGEHVVQAIVVPTDMAAVPRRAGGIAGVIARGDQLVPVVRLEDWLAAAPQQAVQADAERAVPVASPVSSPDSRIVILSDGERVVGLLVEAVIGMQRCPAAAVARLFHDERPDELFACAVRIEADSPPVPMLEPARLAALAGVWCEAAGVAIGVPDTSAHHATIAQDIASTERTTVGMFRIGDLLVGIAVDDIGELLRTPALRAPPMRHPTTRGLCDWRDRLLPVVDVGGLLGAQPGAETPSWMCVVRHGDLVLGLLVHEIVELHSAEIPVAADMAPRLVRHELPVERGLLQLLDTATLMARCPESAISLRSHVEARRNEAVTSEHPYVVFDSGGCYAARIDCVQEIVPLPASLRPRLEAGLPVSLLWRGHAVPVRELFAEPGLAVSPNDARLLIVVVVGGCRIAILIAAVKAMIAPRTATLARLRLRVRKEMVDVVSTAAGPDRATYEVVDLEARALAEQGLQRAA